ncbi:MAG TPA: high-potential iron-sulfur protein [Polyangiaceae bacterium]|nr:high-potential iron-sulfur protein [Polyangiaceae bacterium]
MKNSPSNTTLSRRSLLVHGASAVVALGAAACNKGPSNCNDVSGLTPDQQAARSTLGYEDATTQPGKTCSKCAQYVPAPKVSDCGHCKVLAGTVHPNGYCKAFTAKT